MRLAYLDESGTGDPKTEPHVVVAGVIVNADVEWTAVAGCIQHAADKYAAILGVDSLMFHATEIYGGSDKTPWSRERFDRKFRLEALRFLCGIPKLFNLRVVTGYVDRATVNVQLPGDSLGEQTILAQVGCSVRCTVAIERFMRTEATEGEVAMLVYENTDNAKKLIAQTHKALKHPEYAEQPIFQTWGLREYLPVRRIIEVAHFVAKEDSRLLQLADALAFAIRAHLNNRAYGHELVSCFKSQLPRGALPSA